MIRPTTSVSAVSAQMLVVDSSMEMYVDRPATTETAMTPWMTEGSPESMASAKMAARQKTRLVTATCSRGVNAELLQRRTCPSCR